MRFFDVPAHKVAEPPLTSNDFETVIGGARSSVSAEDLIPFEKWTEQYGQDGSVSFTKSHTKKNDRKAHCDTVVVSTRAPPLAGVYGSFVMGCF